MENNLGGEMKHHPFKWSRRTLLKTLIASPLFLAHGLLRAQDEIPRIRVQLSYPIWDVVFRALWTLR